VKLRKGTLRDGITRLHAKSERTVRVAEEISTKEGKKDQAKRRGGVWGNNPAGNRFEVAHANIMLIIRVACARGKKSKQGVR